MARPSFAIVGAGWRAAFFLRIARALPGQYAVTGMVVRDPERAQQMTVAWGVPARPSLHALLAAGHRTRFPGPHRDQERSTAPAGRSRPSASSLTQNPSQPARGLL
jgi:hypothetical protein